MENKCNHVERFINNKEEKCPVCELEKLQKDFGGIPIRNDLVKNTQLYEEIRKNGINII